MFGGSDQSALGHETTSRARTAASRVARAASASRTPSVTDRGVSEPHAPTAYDDVPGGSAASAVSVVTLTSTARDVLEGAFVPLWVRGEIGDFKAHRNGHWYFSLRDESAQIRCVVWSRDQRRIPAQPDNGMQVVALGQVTVYTARGDLQLSVRAIEAEGAGLWRKALERTLARLAADGLLEPSRKRPIPRVPGCIAVVTSVDGAALHDIVAVVRRRCPTIRLVAVPAAVQGDGAAASLCAALDRVARWGGADVVILGRGGGAADDLRAFNDERLARAVAACPVPVIAAIGHEIDVTLCDLVADLRAPTPSAAAEAAAPVRDEMLAGLRAIEATLTESMTRRVADARRARDQGGEMLHVAVSRGLERHRNRLEGIAGRLHALSPLATLARGYAVAQSSAGETLASTAQFQPGVPFQLLLRDGRIGAVPRTVESTPAAAAVTASPRA